MHNNPWRCDCEGLSFLHFLQSSYLLQSDRDEISCALTNRTLLHLRTVDLCPYSIYLIVIACSLIFSLLGGITVAMFFCCQQEMKIWLYSRNLGLGLVGQEGLDKNKIWDVFIGYADQDEDFVVEKLEKAFEHSARLHKFCINGSTDVLANVWAASRILCSIEESKRTIIVLSPHYIESPWSRLTFEVAHQKSLDDKCSRAIIILYGNVDSVKIKDLHLRRYLQTNSFIRWDDPAFHRKLRQALPRTCKLPKEVQSKKVDDQYVTNRHDIVRVHVC